MEITRKHREAINSDTLRDISIENGMKTLESECKDFVLNGMTTIEELSTIATLSVESGELIMKEQIIMFFSSLSTLHFQLIMLQLLKVLQ